MSYSKHVELLIDIPSATGENPLWHPVENVLYWCDIPFGRLYRYDPQIGINELVRSNHNGGSLGGFTIEADGALLLFLDKGRIHRWYQGDESVILAGIDRETDSRFNDVIAAPDGQVFAGTMSTPSQAGCLYQFGITRELSVIAENIGCSNGLAFSVDQTRLFYTDSFARTIFVFDYNPETGAAGNRREFLRLSDSDGMPDGLTVDAEDHLWSALWDGGCIVRFSPDGKEVMRIDVPTGKVASLTFGGERLDTLYITTAGGDDRAVNGKLAGSLFAVQTNTCGRPEFRSRVAVGQSPDALGVKP